MVKKTFSKVDDFKKKTKFSEHLNLDKRDDMILSMLQKDSNTSQEDIARAIKLSQPSTGARIRKLKEKGILSQTTGINFNKVDLHLAKVDVSAKDTQAIIDEFRDCPHFLNALATSGKFNVCLFFTGVSLKHIEGIVNEHLRGNEKVKELDLSIVISTAKDMIMPMNINYNNKNQLACPQDCKNCLL